VLRAVWSVAFAAISTSTSFALQEGKPEAETESETGKPVFVRIETELGNIDVEIDAVRAPGTAGNFLRYVEARYYDGGQFHRAVTLDNQPNNDVKIEVIQASVNETRDGEEFGPIALERTTETGLSHVDGAISMARDAPDSATSSFFFCIGDQPELDYGGARYADGQGFAAFGRIIEGRDVVRGIQQQPVEEQRLSPPIRIHSVRRFERE
jgi:peptidyl-prolyl cis-trans isomerase A (cyclophilin A)